MWTTTWVKSYHLTPWNHSLSPTRSPSSNLQSAICLPVLCEEAVFPHLQWTAKPQTVIFWTITTLRHLFLKLGSNSFLYTHSFLQKSKEYFAHTMYFLIYCLASILILVFKAMLSCWMTHNFGTYLWKLCIRTCTFPLSIRILPEPTPLNPPKTPTASLHLLVMEGKGGQDSDTLSLKLHRERPAYLYVSPHWRNSFPILVTDETLSPSWFSLLW